MSNLPTTDDAVMIPLVRQRASAVAAERAAHPADRLSLDAVLVSRNPRLARLLATEPTSEVGR